MLHLQHLKVFIFFKYNVLKKIGTAITLNDLDNNNSFFSEKNDFDCYLIYLTEEITSNNYKINELIGKFRNIFCPFYDKFLIATQQNKETLKFQIINELKNFLFDPLSEIIYFFYGSAIEKVITINLMKNYNFITNSVIIIFTTPSPVKGKLHFSRIL